MKNMRFSRSNASGVVHTEFRRIASGLLVLCVFVGHHESAIVADRANYSYVVPLQYGAKMAVNEPDVVLHRYSVEKATEEFTGYFEDTKLALNHQGQCVLRIRKWK